MASESTACELISGNPSSGVDEPAATKSFQDSSVRKNKRGQRNKKKREKLRNMSKKEKREYFAEKAVGRMKIEHEKIIAKCKGEMKEERKKAINFWLKWKKVSKMTMELKESQSSVKYIERSNLTETIGIIGMGAFGSCTKHLYRGIAVCVKEFKDSVSASAVQREAEMMNQTDHPNLPLLFGIVVSAKPYLLVSQFYGINGTSKSFAIAASERSYCHKQWKSLLLDCAEALKYLHSKGLLHCDLKADNVLVTEQDSLHRAILIDFGKVREVSKATKYSLTLKEQELYRSKHYHIAPEVVRGISPPSSQSDIYSFGQLISFVCKYNKIEALRLLAVKCIHGSSHKRPNVNAVIAELNL